MKKIFTDLPEYISDNYVSSLINLVNQEKDNEIELSWLSLGGSFWAGQKFMDYLNNTEKNITLNGTGIIASMGAVIFAVSKNKVAYQSDFMIHSVGGEQNNIDESNQFIYDALSKKINEAKFKEITGHELKTVLTAKGDERFNVWFTGKQAVEMGLADEGYDLLEKNNDISVSKLNMSNLGYELPENIKNKYNSNVKPETNTKNNTDMEIKDLTVKDLQEKNNAVYKTAFNQGVEAEQKRVSEIVKYASHNPEKMGEIINSGQKITIEQVAELSQEKANTVKLNDLEQDSQKDFVPAKPTLNKKKTEVEKQNEAEIEEMKEASGIYNYLK